MNDEYSKIYQRLRDFCLDEPGSSFTFGERLARDNRWSLETARRVIEEYKKFAVLAVAAGHPVSPPDSVDQAWHLHLTYTRSYWCEFCPKVLGRSLHHHPTRGGAAERAKFEDWYRKTLASYERLFGTPPPSDIWPAPEIQFGREPRFVRVDTRRHWLVPKPAGFMANSTRRRRLRVFSWLLILCLVLSSCEGPANLFNPMNLDGPGFFGFYLVAMVVWLCLASWMDSTIRRPHKENLPLDLPLRVEELAYLAGGAERAVDTALIGLIQRGILSLDEDRRILRTAAPDQDLSFLERVLVDGAGSGNAIDRVQTAGLAGTDSIRRGMEWLGLIDDRTRSRLYSNLLVLPLFVLGVMWLIHEIELGEPVFIPIFLLVVTTIVWRLGSTSLGTSDYGDRILMRAKRNPGDRNTEQGLLQAVALLGTSALAGTAFAEVGLALEFGAARMENGNNSGRRGGDGGGGGSCGGCGGCGG